MPHRQARSSGHASAESCYDALERVYVLPTPSRVKQAITRHSWRRRRIKNVPYAIAAVMAYVMFFVLILPSADILGVFSVGPFFSTPRVRRLQSNTTTTVTEAAGECVDDGEPPSEDGALSGYPSTPFTIDEYRSGVIIGPLIIIFIIFYGLAVVCDKYFEPSLEAICDNLQLGPDVAGATFMAAGGSAPELATSLLGVFVSKSDIGIGTIVGSAVFNVLFVIATCAFVAPNLKVTWYPLARDCIFYCISILSLTMVVLDQSVAWWEACILFGLYIVYCTMMRYNEKINAFAIAYVAAERHPSKVQIFIVEANKTTSLLIYAVIVVNIVATLGYDEEEYPAAGVINHICAVVFVLEFVIKNYGFGIVAYWKSAPDAFDGVLVCLIGVEYLIAESGGIMGAFRGLKFLRFLRFLRMLRILRTIKLKPVVVVDASTQTGESDSDSDTETKAIKNDVPKPANFIPVMPVTDLTGDRPATPEKKVGGGVLSGSVGQDSKKRAPEFLPGGVPDSTNESKTKSGTKPVNGQVRANDVDDDLEIEEIMEPGNIQGDTGGDGDDTKADIEAEGEGDGEGDSDDDDDGPFNPFEHGDGYVKTAWWAITLPMVLCMFLTIPDCKRERFAKCWVLTFTLCIVWIAALAYVMVWMATIFGVVAGIPDPVMGLTLLAAGTSIPDALSSLAVARKGKGDMAVSSSIGSNIFDILVGLPVPWMLYGAFNNGASTAICSTSVGIMIITLFIMVALVICGINVEKWHLTMRLGYGFLTLYFVFVIEALLLEYKVILS